MGKGRTCNVKTRNVKIRNIKTLNVKQKEKKMNFLDLIILIPLLWCGIKGARNGLVMEAVSLLALVAGVFISLRFSYLVGRWFSINGEYAQIICFVIMFIAAAVGIYFLGKVLSSWANRSSLGLFNRIGGIAVSFGKVFILLGVLIYFWNKIDPEETLLSTRTRNESLAFRFVERNTYKLWPLMKEGLSESIDSIRDMVPPAGE